MLRVLLHPGEPCHIVGGGPLSVTTVRQVLDDSFVKAVLHDGVAIQTVKHLGRYLPAELRTALVLGTPPSFEGPACADHGCGRRYGVEWDHVEPLSAGGATTYANLRAGCTPHHWEKTENDRQTARQASLVSREPP